MNATETSGARSRDLTSKHRYIAIDGVRVFYREAGPTDASLSCCRTAIRRPLPVPQLPARASRPLAADRADYPGFGYSDIPARFAYTFDGYADVMDRFARP